MTKTSKTFAQGKDEIAKLCSYFASNRQAFLAAGVKEAHVRQSLIDPLFEALGWDVRNADMIAPQYREVVPEDSLDVEGHQKAPDYTFRVGSQAKFFAEAKKCGVNINADPGPAYQLRRYGWSAKVVLSILTDFDELGVYDCSPRPRIGDKASFSRIQYFRSEEYPDRWRELWDIFSREAVWSGLFDQYAASKRKRGTSEVDAEFLKEIEGWRDALARNFAIRNADLSLDDLNKAVQLTIDRIVFLRMAEDRGIEPYEQLLKLTGRPDIYARFMRDLCKKADEKYNSGLFHFQKEDGVAEAPDRITPNLSVDDKVLKPILQGLYFEYGSPYHFGVLPVEILGTVYERFLGKVIRLTEGHQAKIEEKPEVRKAGGVYYTPSYIVEYIVKNTVGMQIKGKSPAQLAGGKSAAPFRVLDMACGSGSFLLGAFQCLLDYSLSWYLDNKPETHKKAVYKDLRSRIWRLTIEEKKRILITHIFGVDIDPQAVEVSKLSLLLKVLEGETDQSFGQNQELFQKRALPNLSENIKCGNSLIGPDYFTGKLIPDLEELKRVNAFDWNQAFPEAMKAGGFDCVIGNPPYIKTQMLMQNAPTQVEYLRSKYQAANTGNYDIYVIFVERGAELLSKNGLLGYILPHKFFNSVYGSGIRSYIFDNNLLNTIVFFGDAQVFETATTYTCLLFLKKAINKRVLFSKIRDGEAPANLLNANVFQSAAAEQYSGKDWNLQDTDTQKILSKLKGSPRLEDLAANIFQGPKSGADTVFILERIDIKAKTSICFSRSLNSKIKLENEILYRYIKGKKIKNYSIDYSDNEATIFPYDEYNQLLPKEALKSKYPLTWEYFNNPINKKVLCDREGGRFSDAFWGYSRPQNMKIIFEVKLLTPFNAFSPSFALDLVGDFVFSAGVSGAYGILLNPDIKLDLRYLLGILNSSLQFWIIKNISTCLRGGYYSFENKYIKQLPIRAIDFSSRADCAHHEYMVKLVESMLALHKQLAGAKSSAQKEIIQRQIDSTDKEIDRLVCELYGLTEREIKIIEGEGVK